MYKYILFLLFFMGSNVLADTCPAPSEIKARNIPDDYDWSVAENISLEQLINVEILFSVRIKNKNEYIACYYRNSDRVIRLDGLPLGKDCRVYHESNNWQVTDNHEWFCDDEDKYSCLYKKNCSD